MKQILETNTDCEYCEDTGEIYFSCCGDDMRYQLPDNDLCPTCLEHCGDEPEECEYCEKEH
jgi:hypothetical protein